MSIELIWAQDYNGGIGKEKRLPWHISEDLKNFKKITLGFPIVMGRKTWASLPLKPLPSRRNIVLSTQNLDNVETYDCINDCIKILKKDLVKKMFIIGGRSVYEAFYPKASVLHLTIINKKTQGIDTFFPIALNKIKENFSKVENIKLSEVATYTKWELK